MEKETFVVAEVGEQNQLSGFYNALTPSNGEFVPDLQNALVFDQKSLARSAMAMYQSRFPEKEIVVRSVRINISLV